MRLLLAEDDPMLGNATAIGLRQDGFAVDWVSDGAQAMSALLTHQYALVLLDLGLPLIDGLSVIGRMRADGLHTPVIVVSARGKPVELVRGLNAGADDYVAKPFDLDVLSARVRAVIRRCSGSASPRIEAGELAVDAVNRSATWQGLNVALSVREYAILLALLHNRGRILSRHQLEEALYGWTDEIESNAVEVHIHHIRRKTTRALIRTVRNVGYTID